jgi:hypothetical protein
VQIADSCPRKKELLLAWQGAAQAYSEAVSELAKSVGQCSAAEYQVLKREAERTRFITGDRRTAFDLHIEEHGC